MKDVLLLNNGVVGNLLALQLAQAGRKVRVLTRAVKPNPEWDKLGIEQVPADFVAGQVDPAVFRDVARFFWVMPVVEQFPVVAERVLQMALSQGIRHIVRHSEAGADLGKIMLSRWHAAADQQLATSGTAYTILRPVSFMQNIFRDQQQSIREANTLRAATGEGRQAFIDAADVAAVAAKVLTEDGHTGKTYALTGTEAFSWPEVARLLTNVLGRPITYEPLTDEQVAARLQQAGAALWLQKAMREFNQEIRAGGVVDRVSPDAARLLGRPLKSYETFLRENAGRLQAATSHS